MAELADVGDDSRASTTSRAQRFERLPARGDAELPQQALHVRTDGVLRDEESSCDLVRAQVVVQQQEYLDLAGAERVGDRIRHPAIRIPAVAHLLEQAPGDR